MPSGTRVQQLIDDMGEGQSQISRAFNDVYEWCMRPGNEVRRGELAAALRRWEPADGPNGLPNLTDYGLRTDLNDVEKQHLCDWPDRLNVRSAMVRALEDGNWGIEFSWAIDRSPGAASRSDIVPGAAGADPAPGPPATDLGGGGVITVSFLTPRNRVRGRVYERDGEDHIDIRV